MTVFLGLGLPHGLDYVWIGAIFILMFGAKKLPELARGLGKSLGEFKKAKQEFENELHTSLKEEVKTPTTVLVPPPAPAPLPGTVAKNVITNGELPKA